MKITKTTAAAAAALLVLCVATSLHAAAALKVVNPRCEYKTNPLGIGEVWPRLSWVLEATDPNARGLKQTGYEILVAGSKADLAADKGDLWSSGKVASEETIQIPYAGKPLASRQACWWKVRVWSSAPIGAEAAPDPAAIAEPSPWSDAQRFTIGLLDRGDWSAKWIGYDEPESAATTKAADDPVVLDRLQWTWTDEAPDPAKDAPAGDRYFARKVTVPEGKKVSRAELILAADDTFEVLVNGAKAGAGGDFHRATVLDLTTLLHAGDNVVAIKVHNDRGPAGLIGRIVFWVEGVPGTVGIDIDKTWKFAKEKPDDWEKPTLAFDAWPAAKEFLVLGGPPWGTPQKMVVSLPPPPMLRKPFTSDKPVKRAMLYASALGLYELHLNGEKVGDDLLAPGWTDFRKRVHFMTYDVTPMIKRGDNALAALLGDGWYSGYVGGVGRRGFFGPHPRLLAQLELEYEDGSTQRIVTDESWRAAYGPWREADLLMGASYDARRELLKWDEPGFNDAAWKAPVVTDPAVSNGGTGAPPVQKILLQPHPGNPVRAHESLPAKSIAEPSPGVFVFDLGQNMVGWTRLKLTGAERGQKITLRHAEMLNPDGSIYTTSLRSARATDTYIAKGDAALETWEPKFTFHGFRYVEVRGLKEKPPLDTITGVVVHSDIARTGDFDSSSPLVDQLFHNIIWGQKGNYLEVPTDCPQRDERLGWTGDAQFFVKTAAYNFDVAAFFTKWLTDLIEDSQAADGSFADVAPDVLGGHGNVAWGDAAVICTYTIYKTYGDTRIIRAHYPALARYVEYLKKTATNNIRGQGAYGDWLNQGGGAKSEVIGTAYYHYVVKLMAAMAAAIDKNDDAVQWAKLSDDIAKTFARSFINADGSIKDSGQTGYALAFTMDLIPPDKRAQATQHFVEQIEKHDWHLATGFIGTPRLLPALTLAGKNDVAYRVFLADTFPSWLFQVKLGATTMWERWDGWTPDKGFQDPAMNSFNHYAFGAVGEWMYRTVAGIDTDGPAFKDITLRPEPNEGLTAASASYDSIRGKISASWKRDETGKLTVNFTIPPNTTATAYVPAKDSANITESNEIAAKQPGVKFLWTERGAAVFKLDSGTYEFAAP
jgi:alpha-L-rhamnosidase